MAKSPKKLITPLTSYAPSRSRLLILDWGSLSYHQLFALSSLKRVANPTFPLNTAQDEVIAWKTKMIREILDMIKLFNPLDILIALEGKHTWRHNYFLEYYTKNSKIFYDSTGFYVSYDNDLIKIYKSNGIILSEKLEDKLILASATIKEIKYENLPEHVKEEVKKILPKYKGARAKRGWDFFMTKQDFNNLRNSFAAEISKIFRAHIIGTDRSEGDDIIYVATNYMKAKYESMVLVTRDSDLNQLLTNKNLVIYNHMEKDIHECKNPQEYLDIKVLSGDTSDSIPGILLPDKKKKLGEAGAVTFYESMTGKDLIGAAKKDGWLNQYMRNRELIDLTLIPIDIQREIMESIDSSKPEMCAFHEVEAMDMTDKLIKEIAKMKDLGYYTLNTKRNIDMNPNVFDPNRSELRKFSEPEKSSVIKRFDNGVSDIFSQNQSQGSSPF